jgi:gliding motility-associated-like protein
MKRILPVLFILKVSSFFAQVSPTWTVNPAAFQYQMTVTAKANENCVDLADTNNYIAAFVGGQCRGVVKTKTTIGPNKLGLITVKSNIASGEVVKFKIYKALTNTVINVLDTLMFSQGASFGTLSNPFIASNNHAPTAIQLSGVSIAENLSVGTLVANITASDIDPGSVFTYSLTSVQPEGTQFQISASQLQSNVVFDYEVDSVKLINLEVIDGGGCTYAQTFTIHITNVNDTPTVINFVQQTISDHQQAASFMGLFSTIDEDFNDSHAYTLVSGIGSIDNAQFYVSHDSLFNVNQINYALQSIYHIRTRSTDLGGLFIEDTFHINVTNVNDAPTDIILTNDTIQENKPVATLIGTLSVADLDNPNDSHIITLEPGGPDNGKVMLVGGDTLKSNASYDFEIQDTLHIKLRATDLAGAYYIKSFAIIIKDVNDAPTALALTPDTIREIKPAGTFVGKLVTTDEDFVDTHVYTFVSGVGNADNNQFTIGHDSLYSINQIDYSLQQKYHIRVRTTDAGSLFFEDTLVVKVIDVNFAPTNITLSNDTIQENQSIGTVIGTFTVTDADLIDTHVLTLEPGGLDNSMVQIAGDTLKSAVVYDYEIKDSLQIKVRATDTAGTYYIKSFVIKIKNINDAPSDIQLSADSVLELQPANTLVGNFSTTDEDVIDTTHVYSLVSGTGSINNAMFIINGKQLLTASTYTYTAQIYSIRVQTKDLGGLTFEKIFQVKVLNINEAPTDILLDTTFVLEDNNSNFTVTKIKTLDPDSNDIHTYTLVSGTGSDDNDEFSINGDDLIILNKTNYDVKNVYHIRLQTKDAGGLSFQKTFDIQVKDVKGNSIPLPSTNYISPNGDGKNDYWLVDNVEIYKEFALQIFDQFGQIIYSVPNNYNNEFDGTYQGHSLPTGNYYYIFKKSEKIFKGNITIVN